MAHPARATTLELARAHLAALAHVYGLDSSTISSAVIHRIAATPSGGALVVVRQQAGGLPVHGTRLTLLLDVRGDLIAAGGQLHGGVRGATGTGRFSFRLGEAEAIAAALADHFGHALGGPIPVRRIGAAPGGYLRYALNDDGRRRGYAMEQPARIRRVLYPLPRRLVPACYLELWVPDASTDSALWSYVISAEDGAVLERRSLTVSEHFDYTVFAGSAPPFTPWDSPLGNTTPLPAGMPGAALPPFLPPRVARVEGLNTNPAGMSDPWLPAGATETSGNNVDAYADRTAPDGFGSGDLRASVSMSGGFDHVYDTSLAPDANDAQQQAAVTHLFYVNNWLHDYFYDLGFDEAAGNAQLDNFGRGAMDGDPLLAQANDYRSRNNANMSIPADGASPRMQMYIWDPAVSTGVDAGTATYRVGVAGFGPQRFDLTAPIVLVSDGTAPEADACQAIVGDLTGSIALIDRGMCAFTDKTLRAQAAGAVGVIIMNNRGGTSTMGGTPAMPISIPALMVSQSNGATLRGPLLGTDARMYRTQDGLSVPSALDTQVVVHEWGHYMHRRLVRCGSRQCGGQSEGWGDFLALLVLMDETDDLDGAYPVSSFANLPRRDIYYGTRRAPYSVNPGINAFSFRHIANGEALPTTHPLFLRSTPNSEVHNAGEIWASMMFQALVALLERSRETGAPYDFEQAKRRMARYVVTGMQLAPEHATFTEQRDALVLAAYESDPEDALRIAQAFADRGAGSCAVSPERFSTTLTGVVEDFELQSNGIVEELSIEAEGEGRRCDADAVLDAGEDGVAVVTVRNGGITPLTGVTVTITADNPDIEMPDGDSVAVPELALGERAELSVPLRIAEGVVIDDHVTFTAELGGVSTCTDTSAVTVSVDRDEGTSSFEDFDVTPPWPIETSLDGVTHGVWSVGPSALGEPDWVLRGVDFGGITDTAAELPGLMVSATEPLIVRFEHRFDFEADDTTLWDGGVIELSTGGDWQDVADFLDPGYTGPLSDRADNPLSLREAYSGTNPSAPDADVVELNFGTAFAGQRVRLRFRIGTDQAAGGPGWEIDDISVSGVTAEPFPAWVEDTADCAGAPTADAGPDQQVFAGETVDLDGTASRDPEGRALEFDWQLLDPDLGVALSGPMTSRPSFTAPAVTADAQLSVRLRVSDGTASDSDDVIVTVRAGEPPPRDAGPPDDGSAPGADGGTMSDAGGGGCGCDLAGRRSDGWPIGAAALVLVGLFARRRRRGMTNGSG